MTSKSNHWITLPGEGVALWWAVLPAPSKNPDALVGFGGSVVDSGKRHRVWDMRRYSAGAGPGDTYEQYVRRGMSDGNLPLLNRRGDDPEPAGEVAVYRDGEIADVVTSDVGLLLRELRPERNRRVTRSAPPIVVHGGSYRCEHAEEISVTIRLDTDLWFPQVVGLREDLADEADETPDWYDNSALAARHTPRFNAFLRDVRAATIEARGAWHFDLHLGGIADRYLDLCNADGIVL